MRLFIAATFPRDLLRELNDRVTRLRPRLPHAVWVRPESQHVTFAFLGDQADRVIDDISPPMTTALQKHSGFEARLRNCGFFPNARHARVGWIGLDPVPRFQAIAAAVRGVLADAEIAIDGAEFKPHLTLMRIRDPWPPASIDLFNRSLRDFESLPFELASATLYSSELNPNGAIHTPLREFALGASAARNTPSA